MQLIGLFTTVLIVLVLALATINCSKHIYKLMQDGGNTCNYIKEIIDDPSRNTAQVGAAQQKETLVAMAFRGEAGSNIKAMHLHYVNALNHETLEDTANKRQPFETEHSSKSNDLKDFLTAERMSYIKAINLQDGILTRVIKLYRQMASAEPEDHSTNCVAELRKLLTDQLLSNLRCIIRAFLAAEVNPYIRLNYDGMTDLNISDVNFQDFDYLNDSIHATISIIRKATFKLVIVPERKSMAAEVEIPLHKWIQEYLSGSLKELSVKKNVNTESMQAYLASYKTTALGFFEMAQNAYKLLSETDVRCTQTVNEKGNAGFLIIIIQMEGATKMALAMHYLTIENRQNVDAAKMNGAHAVLSAFVKEELTKARTIPTNSFELLKQCDILQGGFDKAYAKAIDILEAQ